MNSDGVGDLAKILSPGTNDFIKSLIPSVPSDPWQNNRRPWIGGLQVNGPEPAGGWRWTPNFNLHIFDNYNNFAPGEPNNLGGDENCLQMRNDFNNDGKWNDETCSHLFPYICVRPSTVQQFTTSTVQI